MRSRLSPGDFGRSRVVHVIILAGTRTKTTPSTEVQRADRTRVRAGRSDDHGERRHQRAIYALPPADIRRGHLPLRLASGPMIRRVYALVISESMPLAIEPMSCPMRL